MGLDSRKQNVKNLSVLSKSLYSKFLSTSYFAFSSLYCFLLLASPTYAKQYAGTTGAPFLLITPDARSSAMAGCGVSFLDDAAGLSLNPALLGLRHKSHIQALYSERFADIKYNYLGVAMPVFERGNAGVNLVSLRAEDTRREAPGIIMGTFDVTDLAFTTGYSHYILDNLILGGDVKIIRREIESVTANAFALDAGVLYKDVVNGLNFGCSLQNLGTDIEFEQADFDLPLTLRFGGSLQTKYLNFAMDFDKSKERSLRMNIGAEFKLGEVLRLRTGYKIGNDYSGIDDWTLGFGIKYGIWSLDYSYEQFEDLGDVHRFQTGIEWGKVRDEIKPEEIPIEELKFTPTEKQVSQLELRPKIIFPLYHKGTFCIIKGEEKDWIRESIERVFISGMEKHRFVKYINLENEAVLITELKYIESDGDIKVVGYVWDIEKADAILRVERQGKTEEIVNIVSDIASEISSTLFGPLAKPSNH
ncbi:MAG: PorV/PorQ family protein [Candidatus Hydrogenedentota bacterium]